MYSIYLKLFDFLYSLSFSFNRHTLAIFFGNALPSFIVFLANILSLKVIFFSKSLKYIKQTTTNNRRHRRLQNDIRALLVILIESFSVITISWGIPIFLTMYHCRTLYVVSMSSCPEIKKSLVFFLFTDLFNSSTNCLLYSLSGKLFRRKFISIIKTIFTCGRGILWNTKHHSLLLRTQQSNEPSVSFNYGIHLTNGNYRYTEPFLSNQHKQIQAQKTLDENGSLSMMKISDENETELELVTQIHPTNKFKKSQTFRTFLINTVQLFGSRKKTKSNKTEKKIRQRKTNVPYTSSFSDTGMNIRSNSQRPLLNNQYYRSKIAMINSDDNRSLTKEKPSKNMARL